MDESKALISFQIAGLLIQNSFRYLLNAMKSFNKRRMFKSYILWKNKTIKQSKVAQVRVKNSLVTLLNKLGNLEKTLKCRVQNIAQDSILRIVIAAAQKDLEKKLILEEQNLKMLQENELFNLSKNLKNAQENHENLEKNLKRSRNREDFSKTIHHDVSSKRIEGKSRKRGIKENFSGKILEMQEENQEIKEKIALIEQNISQFLNEVAGLLETSEEPEKSSEKRKVSNKKLKLQKKPRVALNTVDLSKLSLSKCVCKTPVIQTSIEGICTACYGRVSSSKSSRAHTPTLNSIQNSESDLSKVESSQIPSKPLQMSRSSAYLLNNVFHKRSNTSNNSNSSSLSKDQNSQTGYKSSDMSNNNSPKQPSHSLHSNYLTFSANSSPPQGKADHKSPDEPFWRQYCKNPGSFIKPQPVVNLDKVQTSRNKYFQQPSGFDSFEFKSLPRHDRALSSRMYNPSFASIPDFHQSSSYHATRLLHGAECVHNGHRNSVNDVILLQNKAFTCGSDYKVIAWPRLGQRMMKKNQEVSPLGTFHGHTRKVRALEALPQTVLISAGQENKIRVWNVNRDFKSVASLKTPETTVRKLCHLSEQTFVSASGTIDIWDLTAGSVVHSYKVLSAGLSSGHSKLFDLRTPRPVQSFNQELPVTSILNWDQRSFYTASESLWKWDLRSGKALQSQSSGIFTLERAKNLLVAGGSAVQVFENDVKQLKIEKYSKVTCLKFNPLSEVLYLGFQDSLFLGVFLS